MKVIKAQILGVDQITIKDKETGKVSTLYRYYIGVGAAGMGGIKTAETYGKDYVKTDTLNVIQIEKKYKIIEIE